MPSSSAAASVNTPHHRARLVMETQAAVHWHGVKLRDQDHSLYLSVQFCPFLSQQMCKVESLMSKKSTWAYLYDDDDGGGSCSGVGHWSPVINGHCWLIGCSPGPLSTSHQPPATATTFTINCTDERRHWHGSHGSQVTLHVAGVLLLLGSAQL